LPQPFSFIMSDVDSASSGAQTSSKMNSTTLIEGSLTAAGDDESSDDESDDDCEASPENTFDIGKRSHIDSDDDEELEVFVGSEVKSSTRSVTAAKTEVKASKSLVDAMMESVHEVEAFGSSVVTPLNTMKNSKDSTQSKTPLVSQLETSTPERKPDFKCYHVYKVTASFTRIQCRLSIKSVLSFSNPCFSVYIS
jgi:hypothetical protein